jgi:hypothetical protein
MKDEITRVMEAIANRFEKNISVGYGVVVALDAKTDFPTIVGNMEKLAKKEGNKFVLESNCEIARRVSGRIYVAYRKGEFPTMIIDKFIGEETLETIIFQNPAPKCKEVSFVGQSSYNADDERGINFIGRR